MKSAKLKDDIYFNNITLVTDGDTDELNKYIKKKHKDFYIDDMGKKTTELKNKWPTGRAFCVIENNTGFIYFYIWFKEFKTTVDYYEVVVHECFHLTIECLRTVGLKLSNDSEEAYAYYQGYMFNQTLNKLLNMYPQKK